MRTFSVLIYYIFQTLILIKRTWLILVSSFLLVVVVVVVVVIVVVIVGILASRSKDQLHEHKKSYLSSTENSAGKTLEGAVLQNLKDLLQQSHKAKERDNGKSRPASAPLLYVVSLGRSKYSDNHPLSLFLSLSLLVETWPPKATPNPWSSQRRWSPRKVEVY